MNTILRVVLLIVLAGVLVFSGYQVFSVLKEYQQADTHYETVQQEFVEVVTTTTTTVTNTEQQKEEAEDKSLAPIRVDFPGLLSRNEDVVGWLYCPDTVVNYPVVQADDNDAYLHADLSGGYLRSGTLFVECENDPQPMVQNNYIVYGHSMKNGSMFGVLLKYKKQSFYDEHPVWYYLTPDQDYRIELIAGTVVKTHRDIFTPILNDVAMAKELSVLKELSTFKSEVSYGDEDAFITLSTCSYEFDNARYVVVGKLVPLN